MQPKLIFLDFDGVLHPCTAGTFIYLDRFHAFLHDHPDVRVVLSTSWRNDHPWPALLGLFALELQGRFLGVTPELDAALPAVREAEIELWRREHGFLGAPWVALDDDASLFSPGCPELVLCETIRGLRPTQLEQIKRKLWLD
ncbi:hypothetical protein KTD31_00195 [Burkholderia multivorans]|uniref:HAD domain-containing protein n=1 Tax=Burkholderia multivorans TaxID=87883 RepID=UPI001C24316A|nr:HAD domain-containing protein [Burkholderia multivorans]MBU9199818.1 hypothetical protein [Burkholderia multivorans]MDN8079063.1 HAD domain-containing protein [Burkholderia multivorans]